MKAVKANKEYAVTEANRAFYVAQGFDILDDDGSVIEYGKGKTIAYAEYEKLLEEHKALQAEHEKLLAEYAALQAETDQPKKAGKKAGE